MQKFLFVLVAVAALASGYFLSTMHFGQAPVADLPAVAEAADLHKPGMRPEEQPGAQLEARSEKLPGAQPDVLTDISSNSHSISLIGERRPDFKVGSQTGEWVTPDDFPGKVLLINFWATWCAPCRAEMPMLVDLQAQFGADGLQVVGIALDDVQNVRDFVQAFGITYPILVGATDVMAVNQSYGNLSGALPYSVLVDRDGIIRWQFSGALQHDELLEILQKWLG